MTLLVAMIILVMITLLAVSAYRVSNTNLRVVGSMQGRQEGVSAANAVIDQVLSSIQFTRAPGGVAAQHWGIDINGDSKEDYDVKLTPQPRCIRVAPVVLGAKISPSDLPYNVRERRVFGFPSTSTRTTRMAESSSICTGSADRSLQVVCTSASTWFPVSLGTTVMS